LLLAIADEAPIFSSIELLGKSQRGCDLLDLLAVTQIQSRLYAVVANGAHIPRAQVVKYGLWDAHSFPQDTASVGE
jgi:hypothetical protein